jgi:charged multivesicular body protein 5
MGSLCAKHASSQVVESIQQLQSVEDTLSRLIEKYDAQIGQERRVVRMRLRTHHKDDCMRHVRTIHIIRAHRHRLEHRLTACMHKRYQLESLNVTKMHIEAVKTTTKTYRQFLQQHDIDKVEQLQDTLAGMIEDACDMNESLSAPSEAMDIDEDEIAREYDSLCAEIDLPVAPQGPIVPRHTDTNPELEMVPLSN